MGTYETVVHGFGVGHFRSINGLQRLGPLEQITVLAGKNNVGKSNFLRFASKFLHQGELLQWKDSPDYRPQGAELEAATFSLAISVLQPEFRSWLLGGNEHRTGVSLSADLVDSFLGCLSEATGGVIWNTWVPGDARSGVSRVESIDSRLLTTAAAASGPQAWRQISQAFGNQRADALIIKAFRDFAPRPEGEAVMIDAFRQIRDGAGDPWDGVGLIPLLADLMSPSLEDGGVMERNRKKRRWRDFTAFVGDVLDRPDVLVEIPSLDTGRLIIEMDGRTLELADLGTGVHEVVILAAAATAHEGELICLEEPEIHLHPGLQRKLVEFLRERTTNQYLIASHSAQLLDTGGSSAYRVTLENGWTKASAVWSNRDHVDTLADLGYHPTDLLQANSIIWVEGPSDRIYLRHWLRLLNPDLIEGVDYSTVFYGGKLLSHTSGEDLSFRVGEDQLLELRRINRRSAIVIDSDRSKVGAHINATKKRIKSEFQDGGFVWITAGREIENYVPRPLMFQAIKELDPDATKLAEAALDPYDHRWRYHRGRGASRGADKVKLARKVVSLQKTLPDDAKFRRSLRELAEFVSSRE